MVGQLATWSAGKWYLARTPFVEMLDIKAGQTPEGVYKAALAEALTTLKSVLRSDGIETHPVLDIGELPQEAVDLSMDERQLAFVSHVLGWGHLRSARCRFCDRYEAKK